MKEVKTSDFAYSLDSGLSESQAEKMRERFGRNELTPPKRAPWWSELLGKFDDPTIKILLVAAVISLLVVAIEKWALGNEEASFVDSVGIFLAVALATLVGFFSERKSAREFEALNKIKEDVPVKVVRDGQIGTIQIGDLVVGDVVELGPGDKIPADGVLFDATNLYVDQAMLTGESVPVKKATVAAFESLEKLVETTKSSDDAFVARGTSVADGRGRFVTTAVGDRSEMGKIADALAANDMGEAETPLVQKLARLAKQISVVGVVAATGIFTVMALIAAVKSPLTAEFLKAPGSVALFVLASVAIGYLLERFAMKPFFGSMDMELKSKKIGFLAGIPAAIASATILLGIWGLAFAGGEGSAALGVALLKEILLAFVVAVTIIVVSVPEGLPMMVTVSLALNMMKMARENCLVRRLVASETIGSATVICTDKTGTLTENRMTPVRVFAEGRDFDAKSFDELEKSSVWNRLVRGMALNGRANLRVEKDPKTGAETATGIGNPTECALLKFLRERGVDYREIRASETNSFEVGHNSARKFSLVVSEPNDGPKDGSARVCRIKGAPERVLKNCSTILIDGEEKPIEPYRAAIEKSLREASDDALRVLGFSEKSLNGGTCDGCANSDAEKCAACSGRCFIGLVGIADPVRAEVPDAVRRCREAHIQVKMITGDAAPTAVAIAKASGIYTGADGEIALTSEEFAQISDADLPEKAKQIRVLARSTPADKLRLVQALHRTGEVVAMTGDGTNDAPALKAADVGLSMGVAGTEVAKEASDIVLVDDNFKSVVTGVWWGRTLFQNIRRFLQFQLSVNVVALLCALIGPIVGVPLPLTVTQLLWINIIMDTFAAIALSTDPPRPRTMTERPTPRDAHIVTPTMAVSLLVASLYQVGILFAALFGGWFVDAEHAYDASISATSPEYLKHNLQALTIFFTVLVMFQFWHKFNCRALRSDESPFALIWKNRLFLGIVLSITALQIVLVQIEQVGAFFRTTPLSLAQWLEITALTATIIPVSWFGRMLARWLGFEKEA